MLNEFKSKLENGEFVYGVFVKTSDPMFNEIIGISGYDYVILDTEHGPTDIENQQNNIRACELRGILPIVRVPYIDDNVIGKALDIGAMGIQISQIRCAEDAKKVIKYAKFYPEGERGVCRFVRAADYSSLNRNAFFKKENEKIIIIQFLKFIQQLILHFIIKAGSYCRIWAYLSICHCNMKRISAICLKSICICKCCIKHNIYR